MDSPTETLPASDTADARRHVAALYQAHALALVKLAVLMTGDQQAAEDVVQDAFLGLYRRWPSLRDVDKALGYLRSSVLNGCRSVHRVRFRRQGIILDSPAHTARARTSLVTDIRPLELPEERPERARRPRLTRRWLNWGAPVGAAALVTALAPDPGHAPPGWRPAVRPGRPRRARPRRARRGVDPQVLRGPGRHRPHQRADAGRGHRRPHRQDGRVRQPVPRRAFLRRDGRRRRPDLRAEQLPGRPEGDDLLPAAPHFRYHWWRPTDEASHQGAPGSGHRPRAVT